jgi:hypothetical protein
MDPYDVVRSLEERVEVLEARVAALEAHRVIRPSDLPPPSGM